MLAEKHFSYAILGDIGGTNCRLTVARFSIDSEMYELIHTTIFPTQQQTSIIDVLTQFIATIPKEAHPTMAILACAGPVKNNKIQFLSNASHIGELDGNAIKNHFKFDRVKILNDFEANGHAVIKLHVLQQMKHAQVDIQQINPHAVVQTNMNMAVIGPGTGLGECILPCLQVKSGAFDKFEYFVVPCEGGHAAFSPIDLEQCEYMLYLKKTKASEYVCNEAAFAGISFQYMYDFFRERMVGYESQIEKVYSREKLREMKEEGNSLITQWGFQNKDAVCQKLVNFAMHLLAIELSNMCLRTLCLSGIFIVGGMINDFLPYIMKNQKEFIETFISKDKMRQLLSQIPIYVIPMTNVNKQIIQLGWIGCFAEAQKTMENNL